MAGRPFGRKSGAGMRQKITIWERSKTKYGHYEFNHIQDGWSCYRAPFFGQTEKQINEWTNYYWRKTFAFLIDGHVRISEAQDALMRGDK